ncbi:LysE family translocator [Nocardioides sp.]|uniref:LysE family translocator n=1 Tax=Nocardioides sp. TaxID=35761 RepID=UPI003D106AD4
MSTTTLALFVGVTLTMLLVPGPTALYAFTRTLEQGRQVGMFAVAGLETGLLVHVAAASLGVSGLAASSPEALITLRYAGAGYLALLGMRELARRTPSQPVPTASRTARGRARVFRDGLVIDVLNPKTLLFFLALLPQFVAPDRGPVAVQSLLLGMVVVVMAVVCDTGYVLAAGAVRRRQLTPGLSSGMRRASGAAFLGLAVLAGLG